jgi:MFS family permease
MFGVVYGLIESNKHGWSSAPIVLCFVGAALLFAAFVLFELQEDRGPMLDVRLFRSATFVGANVTGFAVVCSLFAFVFFMSLYLQNIREFSPIHTGWIFLIATISMSISSPFAGKAADRVGSRAPITAGLVMFGVGLVAMSRIVDVDSSMWQLYPWLFISGLGFGLVLPPATTAVVAAVPNEKTGVASGLMQAMRQLGGGLGIAIAGAIMAAETANLGPLDYRYDFAFVDGFHQVLLFAGVVCFGAAVACAWLMRKRPHPEAGAAASEQAPSLSAR